MAVHNPRPGAKRRGQRRTYKTDILPAPLGGIDGRASLANIPIDNCIFCYNILPQEYGLTTRSGYAEWAINISGADGVRTLIPFDGQLEDHSNDRLFAVTNTGIFDISAQGEDGPVQVISFPSQAGRAGYGVFCHYVNDGANHFLLYADGENGLYEYEEDTGLWAVATNITGPVIADVRYVMVHKQRIWLIEENKADAWYLPVGSRQGVAAQFIFGAKFKHGGNLVGLWNWTVDGGDGVDDYLVGISRAGDVIVYRGGDPTSVSDTSPNPWNNVGVYYVGELPDGNRCAYEVGGDLNIICAHGLVAMSDLLRGVVLQNNENSLSYKISRFIRDLFEQSKGNLGWEMKLLPSDGSIIVNSAPDAGQMVVEYVLDLTTGGWGQWRGVGAFTLDTWNGDTYFSRGNVVYRMGGQKDNVELDGTGGTDVNFWALSAYTSLGSPGIFKTVHLVRPQWLAEREPSWKIEARYDFDVGEVNVVGGAAGGVDALWNDADALWDQAFWQSAFTGYAKPGGVKGQGRWFAISMRGIAPGRTILVGWELTYTEGHWL